METQTSDPNIPLNDFVRQLKLSLAEEGIAEGSRAILDALKDKLPAQAGKFDTLIILEGRYNELIQRKHRNVISPEDLDLELSKLSEAILDFINHLEASDFVLPKVEKAGKADSRIGKVLYSIPSKMQVEEEIECQIWIAFDLDSLEFEIQSVAEKELRDVRVSDSMGVELFDHGKNEAFEIVTYDEQVQKVEEGLSTHWTFFVTPRKEGKYPLILKISIVLVDENNEKIFKTVVLRELVQISTTVSEEENLKVLAKEAQQFNFLLLPAAGGAGATVTETPKPQADSFWKAIPVKAKVAAGIIGSALLILLLWQAFGGGSEGNAENNLWATIRLSNDTTQLKNFIAAYPNSEYLAEAQRLLDDLRSTPEDFFIDLDMEEDEVSSDPEDALPAQSTNPDSDTGIGLAPAPDTGALNVVPASDTMVATTVAAPDIPLNEDSTQNNGAAGVVAGAAAAGSDAAAEAEEEKPILYRYAATKPIHRKCADKPETEQNDCTEERILDTVKRELTKRLKGLEGSCTMTFVISKEGLVSEIIAETTENEELRNCLLEILQELPDFIPGRNSRGENINVRYTLPVRVKG